MNALVAFRKGAKGEPWRPSQNEAGLRNWLEGKFFATDGVEMAEAERIERELAAKEQRERLERRRLRDITPKATPVEHPRVNLARLALDRLERMEQTHRRAGKVRMQATATIIASAYRINPAEMLSPSRRRIAVEARQHFAWVIRTNFPATSLPSIGAFLKRDHSTIVHAVDIFPLKARLLQRQVDEVNAALGLASAAPDAVE